MAATALPTIEGQYFRDLMEQPTALEATLRWLRAAGRWKDVLRLVQSRRWQRIVLTGMGSSFHTLQPLYWSLIAGGFNPVLMETSELIHYGMALCDEHALIILVSQSGASAETVRLLELQRRSPVLGVTNTEHSPLARRADLSILGQAGTEFSVSCKTYVGGMLSLQWLAAIFADAAEARTLQRLGPAAELARQYLKDWRQHVDALAGPLRGIRHLFLAGRGDSLAAVATGALIIKESAHFHAEGMSSAAFRHGPLEMLGDETFVLVFSGDTRTKDLNIRLLADILEQGSRAEVCGEDASSLAFRPPHAAAGIRAILEILPVQMVTLALAAQAKREPGRFELATKVTITE